MARPRILVVDDEKNIRRSLEMICTGEGYQVATVESGAAARELLARERIDLVLLDINLPGEDGLALLSDLRESEPDLLVIMISGYATVENAVAATKRGAYDFIEKPISKEKLLLTLKNALSSRQLQRENQRLRSKIHRHYTMIGDSPAMQLVREHIGKVAPTDGRVLILGESGTGKELIARAIHDGSQRAAAPFVKVNCAAIPETLIESELFGSVRGAFTGATESREGKFSQADSGTLFLDEVGDMSLHAQAKVLRVLQEGEFEKVGGQKTERVDVRILAATNKNLDDEVRHGRFREDLYFRLDVIPILAPPLRQRREDIPALVAHFVTNYCDENGLRPITLTAPALETLRTYDWPGNIRELRNLVERLIILAPSRDVDVSDLPLHLQVPKLERLDESGGRSLKEVRDGVEKSYILAVLKKYGWNVSQAARHLEIDRTNLHKKIRYYGLSEDRVD